ncbi:hypothetical protein AJ78_04425 [Emergomyces pasteurianus Ep9510]|uniref:Uncharacterized protein n=1 Tax=Emergomyces pasteurianus Ep9510 TaxID=1447872 RepID=A0A1J9QHB3_9EURO|nr:hypothetical protein AJ78_04425 [Emergomyces pasteurianus Ep9510]
MIFLNLPSELIFNIADEIPSKQELNNLFQTCRGLYFLLNNYRYRRDAESENPQALFWAAYKGHIPTARKALSHGADIHARNTSISSFPHPFAQARSRRWDSCPPTLNFTPVQIAIRYRHESMVRFLIQHGANVHEPFPAHHGGYPLHAVSCNGPTGLLKLLLEQGAEVDVCNSKGWTPLYCAMKTLSSSSMPDKQRAARICLLLDYRADCDALGKSGKSPRLLAKKCRDPFVRMMLLGGKEARVSLYEAKLEGRRFQEDFLLKEGQGQGQGAVVEKGTPDCEADNKLDKNNLATFVGLEDFKKGSKPKRPRKRATNKRKWHPKKGKGEDIKDKAKGEGEQAWKMSVQLATLDDSTRDATIARQGAWAKMRAEASQRELERMADGEPTLHFGCAHFSIRLFRIKRKTECGFCRNVTKHLFQCPDCEVVLCARCV